jgi:hypothetical protein
MRRGLFNEALDVLKDMESRYGPDEMIEFNRAVCSYSLGKKEEAVETFRKILKTTDKPPLKKQAEFFIKEWEKSKSLQK